MRALALACLPFGPILIQASSRCSVFWRSDITEPGTAGSGVGCIPLTVKLKVVNVANCTPIANARVDIWHCNEAGHYSGYTNMGGPNYTGQTWFRGIQQTDSEGNVTFKTIFPGWYNGRITHIHFQVYVSGVSKLISQLAFPIELMNAINGVSPYTTIPGKPPYGPSPNFPGANPIDTFAEDNIFNNGTTGQLATMTGDVNSGLVASLDVVVSYAAAKGGSMQNLNGGIRDGKVMLWWAAAQTEEFSHFEIEKSTDWEDFETVARIEGNPFNPLEGAGGVAHYLFTEPSRLSGDAQYRVKMVDKDGNGDITVYLPMKANSPAASVSTNPANEHLIVKHPEMKGGEASLTVVSEQGRELLRGAIQPGATASLMELKAIGSGDYWVVYDDAQSLQVLAFSKK